MEVADVAAGGTTHIDHESCARSAGDRPAHLALDPKSSTVVGYKNVLSPTGRLVMPRPVARGIAGEAVRCSRLGTGVGPGSRDNGRTLRSSRSTAMPFSRIACSICLWLIWTATEVAFNPTPAISRPAGCSHCRVQIRLGICWVAQ